MPNDGAVELARIGARLQAEGDGALRLRALAAMRTTARPLIPRVRQAAAARLPQAGGLARDVSSRRVTVSATTAARTAGVRLRMAGGDARKTDQGYVTHPTFGDDEVWQTQQIPGAAGWWTETLRSSSPLVRAALIKMMAETAASVEG